MAEEESKHADEADFIATLYGDPVRDSTFKAGRNLIIAALLLIAVMKFGAQVQSTSVFPITFTNPAVLPTVLALLVTLLLLNFIARVAMDIGLFLEGERRIERFLWRAKEEAALAAARAVDDQFNYDEDQEGPPDDPEPWWEPVVEVRKAAQAAQETIERRLGRNNLFRLFRQVRAGGEIVLPILFAAIALFLSIDKLQWPSKPSEQTSLLSSLALPNERSHDAPHRRELMGGVAK